MNEYLRLFVERTFPHQGTALDLGAGSFSDVKGLEQMGWECEGVDIRTGVDLENHYLSLHAPYDLVYANYVIHKLKNRRQLLDTAFGNLKNGGWFFLHTFDQSDENSSSDLSAETVQKFFAEAGFTNISSRLIKHYDDEIGHEHWHIILECVGQRP